jgi:hypothetical protein
LNPGSPAERLRRALERMAQLHAERRVDPARNDALERLGVWQATRMRNTYADLAGNPRYADAIAFFQSDLYGSADFAQRDADLARVLPILTRMLPARVIETVAEAMELNVLSHELDRDLMTRLPTADGVFTVAQYCTAYRAPGVRAARLRQIVLIGEVGVGLDSYVEKPFIRSALAMMRRQAGLAGLAVLHDFLERGFHAFRKMRGATEFLATIDRRERALLAAIFDGDDAPFPDPGLPAGSAGSATS